MKTRPFSPQFFLVSLFLAVTANADGPPAELGPMDIHAVDKIGMNQPVLLIYAQANDHRILSGDLAGLNNDEDDKVTDLQDWFDETSWGKTTFSIDQQRDAGDDWYVLPEGILDYASPSAIASMEFRDATQASATNPTPPDSLSGSAAAPSGSDPASQFEASDAGDYWYAVSGFKDGVESTLTRTSSAVSVSDGEVVTLTISKAAADDVDRFILYRTGKGEGDSVGNYRRIGYAEVSGATAEFIDNNRKLGRLANHQKLITAAMTAADADVADYEAYNGVIVILYSTFLRGQASGAQTYTVNGTSFKIQTINQSSSTGFGRFTHEVGHWFGLPDQYDPETAGSRGYWTTMDGANDRQYAAWEKDFKLGWIDAADNIELLTRPAPGSSDFDDTFLVVPTAIEETSASTRTALKIKSSDSVHYYVEGRDSIAGNVSDASSSQDVVVMEAVDAWPPGIYPKRTLNEQKVLNAGDPAHTVDPTVDVTYTSVNSGSPDSYNINLKIKAEEQPDPKITPWGAPPWESPDIWIDSEREGGGWDDPATAVPKPENGESAWVDHANRVYARISNVGGGDATGVTVRFKVNVPGGMGDAGQFVDLPTPAPIDIPAGESRNVYAEWTPTVDQHTCIKVEIEHIAGEEDIYNNFGQENVTHFYSGSASPWQSVKFPVRVANPFDEPKRMDLEIEGLDTGWKAEFSNKWVDLDAETFKTVDVIITPRPDARQCTRLDLDLYAMTQLDDYIQTYGGMNPIIHLANPIQFERLRVEPGKGFGRNETAVASNVPGAGGYRVSALTSPAVPDAEIALIATDPQGNDTVHFARTDANGAFAGEIPVDRPGRWSVYAYYAGDDCNAPTESDPVEFDVPGGSGNGILSPEVCCLLTVALLALILLGVIFILILLLRKRG